MTFLLTAWAFVRNSRVAQYAIAIAGAALGAFIVLKRAERRGEAKGRASEALSTSEASNEALGRMNDAAAKAPRSRRDAADRLRDGDAD